MAVVSGPGHSHGYEVFGRFDFLEQFSWRGFEKWELSVEHHEEHDAQCPHIRRFALVRFAAQHVRRNVRGRTALVVQQFVFVQQIFAQTEIDDFHFVRMLVQHNVAQFQVTMDDISRMQILDDFDDFIEYFQRLQFVQFLAIDQILL